MCDNFKCYSLNVVRECSLVVHKWVWMLEYISPFFQRSLFLFLLFLNIIFTLVYNFICSIVMSLWYIIIDILSAYDVMNKAEQCPNKILK